MRYVVVPQWQGSASDRAMSLADGAEAIAGDLPAGATTRIDVPLEAGDAEGSGILRHSSLRLVRERFARTLEGTDDPVVVIGGDASVSIPAIRRAAALHPELTVVWFDAHPAALDVATSESAAFSGMAARALVDDEVIPAARLVLAGTRAWIDDETAWVTEVGVTSLDPTELPRLADVVPGGGAVFLHIGLDVLDPSVIESVSTLEPFGVELDALLEAVRSLIADHEFAGGSITGFAPRTPGAAADELPAILRILAALRPPAMPAGTSG